MPQALILAGDHYHNPDDAFEALSPLLQEAGLGVTQLTDFGALSADQLADKDLFCILRDGIEFPDGPDGPKVRWMTPAQEDAIEQFVIGGGAMLALHNAGWDYPPHGGYRRTLGGYWIGHPPMAKFQVTVLNHDHPVTAGVEDYVITDEQHWLTYDHDRVTPLLLSEGLGTDNRGTVSGWAYEYGFGRVVYLPHGHTLEIMHHPSFDRLLRNAIRWLIPGSAGR